MRVSAKSYTGRKCILIRLSNITTTNQWGVDARTMGTSHWSYSCIVPGSHWGRERGREGGREGGTPNATSCGFFTGPASLHNRVTCSFRHRASYAPWENNCPALQLPTGNSIVAEHLNIVQKPCTYSEVNTALVTHASLTCSITMVMIIKAIT